MANYNYRKILKTFEKYRNHFTRGTKKERMKKWIKTPAKEKLEWLEEMHQFFRKHTSKREWEILKELREWN